MTAALLLRCFEDLLIFTLQRETDGFDGKSLNVSILQFSQGHRKKWKIKFCKSFCFYNQSVLEQRLLKEGTFRVFDVTSFL